MPDLIVTTYIAYLPIALLITFVVARIFFKNSKIFMLDIFSGRTEIATSTNKLFETGFYLLSLGFALFMMKIDKAPYTSTEERLIPQIGVEADLPPFREYITVFNYTQQDLFEVLSSKIGLLAVVLGGMVFFLLFMLFRGKKKSAEGKVRKAALETMKTQV